MIPGIDPVVIALRGLDAGLRDDCALAVTAGLGGRHATGVAAAAARLSLG